MREVEVTAVLDVPCSEVERKLSPTAIVEYAGTYTVESIHADGETTVVTATGTGIETVLEFDEHENGYVYSQRGTDGPFEEMHSQITIEGTDNARVSARSSFTFGGWLSLLTDWLGADVRRDELERLLLNLARDLDASAVEE